MVIASGPRVDVQRFHDEGYLLIEDVFDPIRDLDPVVAEYEAKLDRVATQWAADGTIASTYADLPFTQRFARILNDTGNPGYRPFDICLGGPFRTDEPLEASMHAGPAVFDLIRHPRLLDVIERLIGGEILSNPIQHVRIKPPEAMLRDDLTKRNTMMAAVAWHQDQGVALPEIDDTDILTVWFPVLDATVENGCLCVVPGSHKRGMLLHCPSKPDHSCDAPPDPALVTQQQVGRRAVVVRPALPANRATDRAPVVPVVRRTQPPGPIVGGARLARLGNALGEDPPAPRRGHVGHEAPALDRPGGTLRLTRG